MSISTTTLVAHFAQRHGARIKIIFGGNSLSLARYKRLLKKYDVVIVIDARGEIDRIAEGIQHDNLILVPLGEGETARSLTQDATPEFNQCVERLPGVSLAFGMLQLRGVGGCATQRWLNSSAFQALVEGEIVPRLLKALPAIGRISLEIEAGSSGGTASRGALLFGEELAHQLRFRLGVIVTGQIHITGGVTTVDLGANTKFNATACTIETADRMLDPRRSIHEVWSAVFGELPAVGTDRRQRDGHVLMAEQALSADEVERELLFRAPNQSGLGECGNLSKLRFGFFTQLDPRTDVAADHVPILRQAIGQVLDAPILPIVAALRLPTEEEDLPQEPPQHLVERAWETPSDEIIDAATQPGQGATADVEVELTSGVVLILLEMRRQFATPPATGSEASRRLSLLRTCLQETERRLRQLRDEVADLELSLARALARLKWAVGLIHPATIFQWVFALLTTVRYKERKLQRTTDRYREIDRELIVAQAQLDALESAHEQLHEEHDFLEGRLDDIDAALTRFRLRGEAQRDVAYVTTAPLDEVFGELWQLQPGDSDEFVLKVLCSATEHVTVYGLAKIVGANEPRLDEIARAIAARRVAVMGPAWGGMLSNAEPLCLHVLPPADPKTADVLRRLIRDLDQALVCFADTAVAAVNVVDLYLEPVRTIADLMPGYYASALIQLIRSPNRALFLPDGLDALDRLGIQIVGDRLVFRSREGAARS